MSQYNDFDKQWLPQPLGFIAEIFCYFYLLLGTLDGEAMMQLLGGIAVALSIIDRGISVYQKAIKKEKNERTPY